MAPTNPEDEKLNYVLTVLKNTDLNKPHWAGVATESGQKSANNAQKRFKKIVEEGGKYLLVDNQIVLKDEVDTNNDKASVPPTIAKGKAKKVTKAAAGAAKKRKINHDDEEEETGDGDEVPEA